MEDTRIHHAVGPQEAGLPTATQVSCQAPLSGATLTNRALPTVCPLMLPQELAHSNDPSRKSCKFQAKKGSISTYVSSTQLRGV